MSLHGYEFDSNAMNRLCFVFLAYETTIFIHVVECPCGLDVKWKCISLDQLQYCNIACVLHLDYRPLLYKLLLLYIIINLFYCVLIMSLFCFSLVSLHGE